MIRHITPAALKQQIEDGTVPFLLDVREQMEHQADNIGGLLAPLSELNLHLEAIPMDRTVVVYCAHGIRSQVAIQRLQEKKPFHNLVNLVGGLAAYRAENGMMPQD